MGGMGPMHMEMCPPEVASAMSPAQAEMMPGGPGPMMDMDGDGMPPPAWGDGAAAGGSPFDGMAPMGDPLGGSSYGRDPMGDAMGGSPMGGAPMGDGGAPPGFDGAMAAMDGAAQQTWLRAWKRLITQLMLLMPPQLLTQLMMLLLTTWSN